MTYGKAAWLGIGIGALIGMTINYVGARGQRDRYHLTVCQLDMHRLRDTLAVIRADRFCLRLIKESR